MATGLRNKHEKEGIHILIAHTNSQYLTYDGIEVGGERVAKEVEDELEKLEQAGHKITKLSVVGYSLGGLIARYCIGLLYSRGWFDKLQPVNFTAFASPFLGVRAPVRGYHTNFWNAFGGHTLSASGQQLFLIDSFRDTGRPLLSVLTDPQSIFIRALSLFKHRVLYANAINDRSAPFYTTGISATDPFEDLSVVDLHPLESYGPTILDPLKPVTRKPDQQLSFPANMLASGSIILSRIPLVALGTVLIPIVAVGFLANSGYQTVRSMQRMRLHNDDSNPLGFAAYRLPLMIEGAVNSQAPRQKLDDSASDEQNIAAEKTGLMKDESNSDFPTLALAPEQFEMIRNLDALGWRKYPVHITKVRHSHAAIIKRIERDGYKEGEQVIKHWVEEEFEI